MMKNILFGVMLVSLVGCGCGDSGGGTVLPAAQTAVFDVTTEFPPCALTPPVVSNPKCPIDILLILDDSVFMNAPSGMGVVPNNNNDDRSRSVVAQRVFQHLQQNLRARVAALQTAGTLPADKNFDFAYGVARYEDFGGHQVNYLNAQGTIDAAARPFMLNMPLLRELHPQFGTTFDAALQATNATGDGNPTIQGFLRQDPQSGIEALWQACEGTGFDGNGDQDTLDNGAPCSPGAQGTTPSAFVDVPAVTYSLNGPDPQDANCNVYTVNDETGANGTCISSGNVGGAGWREGSLRWIILASDIATIAPFADAAGQPTTPPAGTAVQDDPTTPTEFIPTPAFDGVTGRYGASPAVAPLGAATVQETIYALNRCNIEVFNLGAPGVQPGFTKPNLPGANPTQGIDAIENPDSPAFTPFTWMSATSILTNAEVSDDGGTFPASRLFPAVYNLGNVGEWDANNADPVFPGQDGTIVTDDVINGILERLVARVNAAPTGGGNPSVLPQLPTMTLTFTLQANEQPGFVLLRDPTLPGNDLTRQVTVQIPTFYRDAGGNTFQVDGAGQAVPYTPTPVSINFGTFAYTTPEGNPLPQTDSLPVTMLANNLVISNNGTSDTVAAELRNKTADFNAINAAATYQITVWPSSSGDPLPRGVMLLPGSHSGWCLTLDDNTWGGAANFPAETTGNCTTSPFPQP